MLNGGLIGCGFFAMNQLHAWRDIDGAAITAICDRDEARLAVVGDEFGIEARYINAHEMLVAESLDFVDIATTVSSHRSIVELAATHALHVICQKPLAESMADARAMVHAVESTGMIFMVHENFRWQSAIRATIHAIKGGEIGTPFFCRTSFRSGFDVFSGQPYLAKDKRFIIQDLGIHVLDVARALMGDVVRLSATTQRINPRINGEDVATMLLSHKNGASSIVDCSYATHRKIETFPETLLEVDGDKGSLQLSAGYQLSVFNASGEKIVNVEPPLLEWSERPWHNIQDSVVAIQNHFVSCVNDNSQPETSGADNLKTLSLVEGAYMSAQQGCTIELAEL